jgi:hypothetical protein
MVKALKRYAEHKRDRKAKNKQALKFYRDKRQSLGLKSWLLHFREYQRIKGDKLLWQAHQGETEFFQVGITLGSLMSYN